MTLKRIIETLKTPEQWQTAKMNFRTKRENAEFDLIGRVENTMWQSSRGGGGVDTLQNLYKNAGQLSIDSLLYVSRNITGFC